MIVLFKRGVLVDNKMSKPYGAVQQAEVAFHPFF